MPAPGDGASDVQGPDAVDAPVDATPMDTGPDGPMCPSGRTFCAPGCVDLQSDPGSCGACYHACTSGQACAGGACVASDGGTDGSADGGDAGGPVTHDLSTMYPDRVLDARYATYYSMGDPAVTPWRDVDPGTMTGCSFVSDISGPHVSFNIHMLNSGLWENLTGNVFDPAVGGTTTLTWSGSTSPSAPAMITATLSGPRYTANGHDRMSFHITFRVDPSSTSTHEGVTGVAGETTFADQGDAWVLGCPLN